MNKWPYISFIKSAKSGRGGVVAGAVVAGAVVAGAVVAGGKERVG
jgi:hypothetical protein